MDLNLLWSEMVKAAMAYPYRVPRTEADLLADAANLVSEKCAREVVLEGKRYTIVFSLNVIEIPKGRFLIFWPDHYETHHFWHLTITGRDGPPDDRLMARIIDVFFIRGEKVLDVTEDCKMRFGPLMPPHQRQYTQMIPHRVIRI